MDIGLIVEGTTDYPVLENILKGYFKEKNISVTPLQPANRKDTGNWDKIGKYLAHDDFRMAFDDVDYVVIQIDSDVFTNGRVLKQWNVDFTSYNVPRTMVSIRQFLISKMSKEIYKFAKSRIAFAIAVSSTECWFLPLMNLQMESNQLLKADCIASLKHTLLEKFKFALNKNKKNYRRYEKISLEYLKENAIQNCLGQNPSFDYFIKQIKRWDKK